MVAPFKPAPINVRLDEDYLRQLTQKINQVQQGKTNNISSVTLTASSALTTVTDARISTQSVIALQPQTANAAAALSTSYIPTPTSNGSFVINHANTTTTDRTFQFTIIG